jgi:hypothetical protein
MQAGTAGTQALRASQGFSANVADFAMSGRLAQFSAICSCAALCVLNRSKPAL